MDDHSPSPPADARGRLPRPITADEFARMVAAGVLDNVPARRTLGWPARASGRPGTPTYFSPVLSIGRQLHRTSPRLGRRGGCPVALGPWHMPDVGLALIRGGPRDWPSTGTRRGPRSAWSSRSSNPARATTSARSRPPTPPGACPGSGSSTSTPGRSRPTPSRSSSPRRATARSDLRPGEPIPLVLDGRQVAELDGRGAAAGGAIGLSRRPSVRARSPATRVYPRGSRARLSTSPACRRSDR